MFGDIGIDPATLTFASVVVVVLALLYAAHLVLGVADTARRLWFPTKQPADELINKAALAEALGRTELLIVTLEKRLEKQEEYVHRSVHDLRDMVHALQLKQESHNVELVRSLERVSVRLEEHGKALAELTVHVRAWPARPTQRDRTEPEDR